MPGQTGSEWHGLATAVSETFVARPVRTRAYIHGVAYASQKRIDRRPPSTGSISIPAKTAARIDWHKIRWPCYGCQKGTQFRLPSFTIEPHYTEPSIIKTILNHEVIYWIEKIREFERLQLPFLKSVIDFDIVIEIGYAEEQQGQPLTLKQLFLLNISSRTTVRRKLARLIEQGIVIRRKHANDHRASLLIISPSTVKLLSKYGGTLTSISTVHFK
jgi:hypothetical protein